MGELYKIATKWGEEQLKTSTKITGDTIRKDFLNYFEDKGHKIVPSSSLVPVNDPTLLFTNAGMNQFKDVFTGKENRKYKKACSCQKVVRAGGKHNDLENVGRTARHHTFFEMLGNFSFGDYFKYEAIGYAWDFLTSVLGLPEEKLLITIYRDDEEAYEIWKKIGVHENKIFKKGDKDNFWSMGETGPCGPCSEIHIDQGKDVGCGRLDCSIDCDCDRYLELWNLVFMQYKKNDSGELSLLPHPCIDTGMGLERITAVMQGVHSNYETDLFTPIINFIAEIAGVKYGSDNNMDISMRVIADHGRGATFLIGDGVLPSNEARGYVLRRIIRRAIRHGRTLGIKKAFLYKICEYIVDFMKQHYLELSDKKEYISNLVKFEEERFKKTLDIGLKLAYELFDNYSKDKTIPGEELFKLHDTYGFPIDILEDIADDKGYILDTEGFISRMSEQKAKAQTSWLGVDTDNLEDIYKRLSSIYKTSFTGYDLHKTISSVLSLIKNNQEINSASAGEELAIILSETTFYSESGGQVGDKGLIENDTCIINVHNTKKMGNSLIVHFGKVTKGKISTGDTVLTSIDEDRRWQTEKNHTATHLLHKALQIVVGDHVRQAGSFVSPERLRFDFNHFSGIPEEDLNKIECLVNEQIQQNKLVKKVILPFNEAVAKGAMALFGEKYESAVRVVEVNSFSKELCGGCHVRHTGEIGFFKILSENGIASGVRRIEAVTGRIAIEKMLEIYHSLLHISSRLKTSPSDLIDKTEILIDKLKKLEHENQTLKDRMAADKIGNYLKHVKTINDINILSVRIDATNSDNLRNVMDILKSKIKSGIILIGYATSDKVNFLCGVTSDIADKFPANLLVKEISEITGGSGGGKKDLAQAGGKKVNLLDTALNSIYTTIANINKE